nr:MAG TPA: minor tail protein [Caudoviricetes sp.]
MAENTIDTLNIQISSSTAKAVRALENLSQKLTGVNRALNNVNTGGLRNYARDIGRVSASIKSLNGVKITTPNLSGLSRQLASISNINFSALDGSGNSIKDFATGLSALNGLQNVTIPKIDAKNINSITRAVEKLAKIDVSGAQQTIDSIQRVAHSMSILNTVDFSDSKIIPGINALRRLMSIKTSDFDASSLDKITVSLGTFSNIPDVSQNLNRFLGSLQRLANSGSSIGTVVNQLPLLSIALKNTVDTIASANTVPESINLFVQAIGKLAGAGNTTGQTASQLSLLSREVINFFNVMQGAPQISENTIRMTEALAQLANAGGRINGVTNSTVSAFSRLSSAAGRVGSAGNKITSIFRNASYALSGFSNTANKASKSSKSLTSQITSLYVKFFTLKRIITAIWKSISSASNYVETLNYFNSAFDQVTEKLDTSGWRNAGFESAEEYVSSFEKKTKELTKKMTGFEISDAGDMTRISNGGLGLNPNDVMNYQATYAQMASSMGATADASTKVSQALTEIGADLASVKNLEFNDVWNDMASGITGMSRALDKYGINIRVANLQQELYNLGIDATVSSLSQSDKAILRTITILNSSKYAWADLSSTINQPANQVRMLKSNFESLARSIGTLLLPIVAKILPYLNGLTMALERTFSWVAKLFGIKISDYVSSTGKASVDMGDIADSTDNAASGLDNANDNAKKLQKTLSVLSFDELNQLNDNKTSSSSGSSGSGTLGSAHIPELDAAFDKALSDYQKAWDQAFANVENKSQTVSDKIIKAFKQIRKNAKPTTAAIKKLYNEGLSRLGNFSINALKNLWKNYLQPIGKWSLSNNSGLPRFFNITNDLLTKINWLKLQTSLEGLFTILQKPTRFVWTGLMDFYEYFLVPVGTWTMNGAIPQLVDALTNFGNNIHWEELNKSLKNFWDALAPFAKNVGQGLVDFYKDLLNVGENFINSTVPGGLNSIAEAIKNISPETAQAIGKSLGQISLAILGFKGLTFIGSIIGTGSPLAKGLSVLARHPYAAMALGIGGIVLALDNFGVIDVDWEWIWSSIDRVKEAIQNFIDKVDWTSVKDALGNLWNAFQPFAEGFADALIDAFTALTNISADILNGVAGAINYLAEALDGTDPELIKQVGYAFGILFAVKISADFATKLINIAGAITTFGTSLAGGSVAAATSGFAKALLGLSAALVGVYIGMKATENEVGEAKDVSGYGTDMAKGFNDLSTAVESLGTKAGISEEDLGKLNTELENMRNQGLIYDPTAIQNFADKLYAAGIKADDLKNSIANSSEVTDQLRISLEDAAVAAEFKGANGIDKLSGALDGMYGAGKISLDQYKELNNYLETQKGATDATQQYYELEQKLVNMGVKSEELSNYIPQNIGRATTGSQTYLDNFNVSVVVEKLKSLKTESDKVSFAHMITETSNTIDSMGGLWENGKQILGEKALAVHDEIQKGLQPDEDGYYKLANGQMVQYGNAIKDNETKVQNTLGDVLKKALSEEGVLPEGYQLMWDAAGYHIDGYTKKLEDSGTTERIKKAYEDALNLSTSLNSSLEKDGGSLAENVVAGYENYMKGTGKTNVSSAMKDWAKNGITGAVETSLEIHSPSKVFEKYAEYSEAGFSNKIKSLFPVTAIAMINWVNTGIVNPVTTSLKITSDSSGLFSGFAQKAISGFNSGITSKISSTETIIASLISSIERKFDGFSEKFSPIGNKYISKLCSGMSSERGLLLQTCSELASEIKSTFDGISLYSDGRDMAQGFVDGIKSVHFPNLSYRISGYSQHYVNGHRTSTPIYSPNWYAKGGLFNGAQVIGIGEAGAEAVLPLENPKTMKKIADSITSNMDNSAEMGLTKDEIKQAVAQGVAMSMSMNSGNKNPQYIMNSIILDGSEIAKAVSKAQKDTNSRFNPSPAY